MRSLSSPSLSSLGFPKFLGTDQSRTGNPVLDADAVSIPQWEKKQGINIYIRGSQPSMMVSMMYSHVSMFRWQPYLASIHRNSTQLRYREAEDMESFCSHDFIYCTLMFLSDCIFVLTCLKPATGFVESLTVAITQRAELFVVKNVGLLHKMPELCCFPPP